MFLKSVRWTPRVAIKVDLINTLNKMVYFISKLALMVVEPINRVLKFQMIKQLRFILVKILYQAHKIQWILPFGNY